MCSWPDPAYVVTALVAVVLIVPVLMAWSRRTTARPLWQTLYLGAIGALVASVLVLSTVGRAVRFARSFDACEAAAVPYAPRLSIRLRWNPFSASSVGVPPRR
jgi:hypothetical protein